MDNLFFKYMKERTGKRKVSDSSSLSLGPVITISREYGCPAVRLAEKLAETLTQKNSQAGITQEWRVVSKEIIEESARELKLQPSLVQDLTDYKHNSFFENMALFFSDNYYPGNAKIKNTIAKFIYETACEGNVIIVGRAGEAITQSIKRSFHVKIVAPLDWRAQIVSKEENLSISDAKKRCIEQDMRREQFRRYFEKDMTALELFNMVFNAGKMTDEEIIELLVIISEIRGFV